MNGVEKARMKVALSRHYAARRQDAGAGEVEALAAAMLAEDARARASGGAGAGPCGFVAAQARFIPAWVWAAQAAIVAVMVFVAGAAGGTFAARWAVGALSAASVLAGVPALHSSRLHGVAELECSCRHDVGSVMAARLVALGCSCSLCTAVMVAVASAAADVGALTVALWACPPYFCSCAGALLLLRRARLESATLACVAWTATCCGALYAVGSIFPGAYGDASLAVWGAASAAALAWLAREAALTVRSARAGLDVFSPQTARTGY